MEFYLKLSPVSFSLSSSFNSQRDGILHLRLPQHLLNSSRFNSQRDGILQHQNQGSWVHFEVSIPNGMEFYEASLLFGSLICVSIPNGMEFYVSGAGAGSSAGVSIPNGMEFYQSKIINVSPLKGFNSQRDGILRCRPLSWSSPAHSFNSQRDGILQFRTLLRNDRFLSFNSQRDGILLIFIIRLYFFHIVSIPNGMEFYPDHFFYLIKQKEFQFPTGWNSTHSTAYVRSQYFPVSIPNGMEFYLIYKFLHFLARKFQFPTGWNSTYALTIFDPLHRVSIPNGMEFYR